MALSEILTHFYQLLSKILYEFVVDIFNPIFHLYCDVFIQQINMIFFLENWLQFDDAVVIQASEVVGFLKYLLTSEYRCDFEFLFNVKFIDCWSFMIALSKWVFVTHDNNFLFVHGKPIIYLLVDIIIIKMNAKFYN